MHSTLLDSLSGLLDFCTYFGAALAYTAVFCTIYCKITPYDELKLIREGNSAPAISFAGALIGFILPLYSAITHSVGLIDMLIWALFFTRAFGPGPLAGISAIFTIIGAVLFWIATAADAIVARLAAAAQRKAPAAGSRADRRPP